jgi:guanosine-3',5'-bis(diphosphate) 3'-pyrophosphohydrolase
MIDLEQVTRFCLYVHEGQTRRYSGDRQVAHCARVAAEASITWGTTPAMVAAAWLHDAVEDQPERCSFELLTMLFGDTVASLVHDVTNVNDGARDRAERKALDRKRLATISTAGKVLKMIDRRDNVNDLAYDILRGACIDIDFGVTYAQETLLLVPVLAQANQALADRLTANTNQLLSLATARLPGTP